MNCSLKRRDPLYRLLIVLIMVVNLWLVLTPFWPAVARQTMQRFHLGSSSFAGWCLQQPVPAMYNFANTIQVFGGDRPDRRPVARPDRATYLNHFPARGFTFGNQRKNICFDGDNSWVCLTSRFQSQKLESWIYLDKTSDGEQTVYDVKRVNVESNSNGNGNSN